ncbi:helix-turn-helix transcriptional regulator [Pseudonocardia sp.]|uniref:AraC family transcriptional regulator n=1 Tax=Pseudonocardia sp. TaxID=60912 RepID=UPI0026239C38|nr:helix-turn-helix transcriptional regulator [Pseudonocardia sp.]
MTAAAISILRYRISLGGRTEAHTHDDHQLVWAPEDVLMVDIEDRSWILPPPQALFVPAGVVHATSAREHGLMAGVHLPPELCPLAFPEPTVVSITPLLRQLLLFLESGPSGGPLAIDSRAHAEALVYDLLEPVSGTTVHLPMPVDVRAREVADTIVADPGDTRTLGQWAFAVGSSVRSLSRAFTEETGMPFARWRTQVRLRAALLLLAERVPVKTVARAVGYETTSSFVAVFRRHTGRSPASFRRPMSSGCGSRGLR